MKDKEDTTPDEARQEEREAELPAEEPKGQLPAGEPVEEPSPQEKLGSVERERDEYLDMARRARADYANLQRRLVQQNETVREAAQQELAKDFLPILDDLESAIKHTREGQDCSAIVKGLEIVTKKFVSVLARYGIEAIEAEGMPFDHNLHHAIAEHPTDDAAPGTVYAVAQKGYTAGGKLLRPAHVVVTRKPEKSEEKESEV